MGYSVKTVTLQTRLVLVAIVALVGLVCRHDHSGLQAAASNACLPDAYILELPQGGTFILNGERRDSLGVEQWLKSVLSKRTGSGRVVYVHSDTEREPDLRWLLPAILHAGGIASALSAECVFQVS